MARGGDLTPCNSANDAQNLGSRRAWRRSAGIIAHRRALLGDSQGSEGLRPEAVGRLHFVRLLSLYTAADN